MSFRIVVEGKPSTPQSLLACAWRAANSRDKQEEGRDGGGRRLGERNDHPHHDAARCWLNFTSDPKVDAAMLSACPCCLERLL